MSVELENVLSFSQTEQRICPQPQIWNELWELLPNKKRISTGWQPPLPLILAAWSLTSDEEKRNRFLSHIHWAEKHGALPEIANFIKLISSEQWHYEGQ